MDSITEVSKSEMNCLRKKPYASRSLARKLCRQAIGKHKKKLDVYKCPHCRMYHLTKRDA